jgi:hypothetical protein
MISDALYERLLKLRKEALLNVMLSALDEMQAYNGRTMTECVMLATNSKEVSGCATREWVMPSVKKLNETSAPPF